MKELSIWLREYLDEVVVVFTLGWLFIFGLLHIVGYILNGAYEYHFDLASVASCYNVALIVLLPVAKGLLSLLGCRKEE